MNVSLTQAAAALNANSRWQEMITENLASSSVPGYRKQDLSFSAIQAGILGNSTSSALNTVGAITFPQASAATNFNTGEMISTGVATHLAIEGNGFFEVQLDNGKSAYTRSGEFHIDSQGRLVTTQGYQVMGENGILQFDPNNTGKVSVTTTGEVSQGTESRGKIKLVEFAKPELLTSTGTGLFLASDPSLTATPATNSQINQGYLESANTTPVSEMVNLITSMRSFEANQKVIQLNDERTSRAINELGNPS